MNLFGQPPLHPTLHFLHEAGNSLCPSSCVNVHHELSIRPRHYSNLLVNHERIVELPSWLCLTMFHIPHLAIDSHLNSRPSLKLLYTRCVRVCMRMVIALSIGRNNGRI